ncbi:NAD(P)H-hydrate epimerase [Sphingomonas sp. SUN039]|uniref:NAD(P)H-hydrate epimerase n=1 Tax=Sphingomonas sp. SUN039 TaxID=2937787 RepID=UPI002164BD4B|nr:NAD(P)H-hydrate epimerase [Sphingomonas sp. SUN039]UVO53875.1 NAD(P)H-hydrate epimerase [Sphingomonas sp. SUN039]
MRPLGGPVLTAAEMRAAELGCGVPLDELMERAGRALAEAALRFGGGAPVLVLCGPGNNGGDGYVAARVLAERGITVRVAALAPPKTDLASGARAAWSGDIEVLDLAHPAPIVVDALFGTGLTRPLDAMWREPLVRFRGAARFVIAADLPSGVGADDGTDFGAVSADLTLAFGTAKPAHLLQPTATLCGRVIITDIGVLAPSRTKVLRKPFLSAPSASDHKYTRGMVAVVASDMAGAATLGATAAAHLAGYTVLCGKGEAPASVVRRGFEATLADPKLGAMLIGPGLSDTPANRIKLDAALASQVPLVIDAGALGLVTPGQLQRQAPTILTPHEGEVVRLFGRLDGSKIDRARIAAERSGATVIYKGSDTVIASPDGRVTLAPPASPWLATAGTGDVLAGIATAMLGRGLLPHEAASAAVWLHGDAASRAGAGFIADDLCRHIPAALSAATR